MKIFLVRHGDADAEIPEGLGDEGRALTAKARLATQQHFSALTERFGELDLILTSPLVRCVQTAQILAISTGYEGLLRAHRSLLPEVPVGAQGALLAEMPAPSVVLVGHQPSMGALAAHLLGMQLFPKPVNPGTVIGLELDEDRRGRLLFYAPPAGRLLETV